MAFFLGYVNPQPEHGERCLFWRRDGDYDGERLSATWLIGGNEVVKQVIVRPVCSK